MDNRWGSALLGFNTDPRYNIHNYGCLLVCLAIVACYHGKNVTPKDMNELLKDVGGFSNGGCYNWGAISKIFKDIEERWVGTPRPLTDSQMDSIKEALDSGFPVIAQLDYNPRTAKLDMHYVLFIGYNPEDENDFTIVDPLGGKVVSLKKYLGWWRPNARRTIEQFIIYEGAVSTYSARLLKKIEEMETAFKELRKDHDKKLAETEKDCRNKILEVKKILTEAVKRL